MFNAKMDVLVQTFILGLCLAAEAFQCPTMDSCVEAPVTKLFGVDSSSVSKDQIVSSLIVTQVSSLKLLEYKGMLPVYLTCYSELIS